MLLRWESINSVTATLVLAVVTALCIGPLTWAAPQATAAEGAVVVDHDVELVMRDGVVLRADVARPARPGQFPVIVTQTAYNKQTQPPRQWFVEHGYVHVVVDVRGTGSSEGVWSAYGADEQADGAEIVEWAADQPWSTGMVGLWGASYSGQNQFFTARHHPRGLAAMFPIVSMGDAYRDLFLAGGQMNSEFLLPWMAAVGAAGTPGTGQWRDPIGAAQLALSHYIADLATAARVGVDAWTGGDLAYDGDFWRSRSPLAMTDEIDVPTYVVAGLDDIFQRGGPMLFEALRANGTEANLLLGPWTHSETIAGAGLPADGAPFTLEELALRWFDHHLKGIDTGVDAIPDVVIYERGTERWRAADAWPDPSVAPDSLFLADGSTLVSEQPGLTASSTPLFQQSVAGVCSRSTWQYSAGAIDLPGCTDDPALETAIGLDWMSAPITRPIHLQGSATADLWVSTTARDAFVTARLVDIAPDGTATELTAGWLTASHRSVDDDRSRIVDGVNLQPWHPFTRGSVLPVSSGEVMRLQMELQPVNVVVEPGHQLRLVVTPSDVPRAVPTLPDLLDQLGGVITVHSGGPYPSAIHLPVVAGSDS